MKNVGHIPLARFTATSFASWIMKCEFQLQANTCHTDTVRGPFLPERLIIDLSYIFSKKESTRNAKFFIVVMSKLGTEVLNGLGIGRRHRL